MSIIRNSINMYSVMAVAVAVFVVWVCLSSCGVIIANCRCLANRWSGSDSELAIIGMGSIVPHEALLFSAGLEVDV